MYRSFSSDDRLDILRGVDRDRHWSSVDDKRVCVICEREINGRQIEIRGGPTRYTLHCPTMDCPGRMIHWLLSPLLKTAGARRRAEIP